jgi:hypothetical protein
MIAAPASMERWLEIPHEAAGPLVTPTKPILSTSLADKVIGEYALVKTMAAVTSDAFKAAHFEKLFINIKKFLISD